MKISVTAVIYRKKNPHNSSVSSNYKILKKSYLTYWLYRAKIWGFPFRKPGK